MAPCQLVPKRDVSRFTHMLEDTTQSTTDEVAVGDAFGFGRRHQGGIVVSINDSYDF